MLRELFLRIAGSSSIRSSQSFKDFSFKANVSDKPSLKQAEPPPRWSRKKRPPRRRCRCRPLRRLLLLLPCPGESCRGPDASSPWPDTSNSKRRWRWPAAPTTQRPLTPPLTLPSFAPLAHSLCHSVVSHSPSLPPLKYRSHASPPITAQFCRALRSRWFA